MSGAAIESQRPGLLDRVWAVLYHCARVLFMRWPNYTLEDLAAIQDNLDGPAFSSAAQRMKRDSSGAQLLRTRPILRVRTTDWRTLSQLPTDTLGYNFWHHFHVNALFDEPELQPPVVRWDDETEYAKQRYRSTHDVRHVLLGLGVETHEEVLLQTFQFAQLPQKLSALVVVFGALKAVFVDPRWWTIAVRAPRAWRTGKAGRFLNNIHAEQLWDQPLDQVRRQFEIAPISTRYPVAERHPDAPPVAPVTPSPE